VTDADVLGAASHALKTFVLALGPAMLPALVAGLLVAVVQAATSINESALGFAAKLIATAAALLLLGGLLARLLTELIVDTFERVPALGQ
jgi:flagellar biosynthetic protein FliQ